MSVVLRIIVNFAVFVAAFNPGHSSAIADKASNSYVDSLNAKQDIAIADKASKSYVDTEIAKIPLSSQDSLLLDGTKAINADLDMGNNKIIKLDAFDDHKVDDDYDTIAKDLKISRVLLNFLKR